MYIFNKIVVATSDRSNGHSTSGYCDVVKNKKSLNFFLFATSLLMLQAQDTTPKRMNVPVKAF